MGKISAQRAGESAQRPYPQERLHWAVSVWTVNPSNLPVKLQQHTLPISSAALSSKSSLILLGTPAVKQPKAMLTCRGYSSPAGHLHGQLLDLCRCKWTCFAIFMQVAFPPRALAMMVSGRPIHGLVKMPWCPLLQRQMGSMCKSNWGFLQADHKGNTMYGTGSPEQGGKPALLCKTYP